MTLSPPSYPSNESNPAPFHASNELTGGSDTSSLEDKDKDRWVSPPTTRHTYYRIYSDDDTMLEVVNRAYPADPFLGRVATFSIAPPHTARNVRRQLSKWEGANPKLMTLYDPSREADSLGDNYPMLVWDSTGHGSTPACPLVLMRMNCPMTIAVWDPTGGIPDFIRTLYLNVLDRDPESQEVIDYHTMIAHNRGLAVAIDGFFNSPEYHAKKLSTEVTVKKLYRSILGREPEPDGMEYHIQEINQGRSVSDAVHIFVGCPEYTRRVRGGLAPRPEPAL